MSTHISIEAAPIAKEPRTERGRRARRKLLDAATAEFGAKGFHEASISAITSRAGMALGSFYTYFYSKDEIFKALVQDFSTRIGEKAREAVTPDLGALETERAALHAFLEFAAEHKEVYRVIDEAEFVDPASHRAHYETTAARMFERLRRGVSAGDLRDDIDEAHAWAIMGMNVFLGMRYAVWSEGKDSARVADIANDILRYGLVKKAD